MKFKFLTGILLIITILFGCQNPKQQALEEAAHASGSLFIIGGGSRPFELMQRLVQEANLSENDYVVVLPMASEEPDTAVFYVSKQFVEHNVRHIAAWDINETSELSKEILDSISNAKLIYIPGGDQNQFMHIANQTGITARICEAYSKGAMIAGTSAGAAVMSELMITGNELRYPDYNSTFKTIEKDNIELAEGLGFIKTAIIDQHFVWRSRHNRLLSAVIEHPELAGVGIDESTALLVKKGMGEVVGVSQILVYSNPEKSFYQDGYKIGAQNLRIDIFLPGQKFPIK